MFPSMSGVSQAAGIVEDRRRRAPQQLDIQRFLQILTSGMGNPGGAATGTLLGTLLGPQAGAGVGSILRRPPIDPMMTLGVGQQPGGGAQGSMGISLAPQGFNPSPAQPQTMQTGMGEFGAGMGGFAQQVAQEAIRGKQEQLKKAAEKSHMKTQELLQQMSQLQPPKPQQPMGYRDLLPLGGLALLAKLLGAQDKDIGEGIGGFMQGRQGWAQGVNENANMQYQAKRQNLGMMADMSNRQFEYDQNEADRFEGRVDKENAYARGRKDRIEDDVRNYEQTIARDKNALEGKRDLQREAGILAGLKSNNPEIRMLAAAQFYRGDPDAVAAYGKLSPAEQNAVANAEFTAGPKTENMETKTAGQDLKNEVDRKWADKTAEAKYNEIVGKNAKIKAETDWLPEKHRLEAAKTRAQIWKMQHPVTGQPKAESRTTVANLYHKQAQTYLLALRTMLGEPRHPRADGQEGGARFTDAEILNEAKAQAGAGFGSGGVLGDASIAKLLKQYDEAVNGYRNGLGNLSGGGKTGAKGGGVAKAGGKYTDAQIGEFRRKAQELIKAGKDPEWIRNQFETQTGHKW